MFLSHTRLTRIPVCTLIILLIASILCAALPASAQTPAASPVTQSTYNPDDLLAIKPSLREEIAASLPPGMPVYDIDLTFPDADDDSRTLTGSLSVVYTNTTGNVLDAVPFRLYANGPVDTHDAVTIDSALVGGEAVDVALTVENSVATIPLPEPLAPDDSVQIDLAFTTHVPTDKTLHYGIFNYASSTETWSLAHWYPVIAGRDPEAGWMLEPTSTFGDPIFTDAGLYTVAVTAPEDLSLITSGIEVSSGDNSDGMTTTVFNAAPSRDFVLFADADMEVATREVDGTAISSWYEPGNEDAGETVVTWSEQSLTLFNELLGEYPFQELHLAEIDIYNAAGVEFPQLIAMDAGYYQQPVDVNQPGFFSFTVAHEVVHQWFYSIVGNNQYDDAFIDEGLTNYLSSTIYFTEFWNEEVGEQMFERTILRPYENAVRSGNDPIVDTPTDDFASQGHYVTAAYSKAPVGFAVIHEELGDDAFFGALQAYVEEFQFRVATPEDLLAAFEATSDADVEAIWNEWFLQGDTNGSLQNGWWHPWATSPM